MIFWRSGQAGPRFSLIIREMLFTVDPGTSTNNLLSLVQNDIFLVRVGYRKTSGTGKFRIEIGG